MPRAVEQKFEIELKSFPIKILGYIDVITEDGYVIDHKTCWVSTAWKWNQKYVDRNHQLTVYALAYRKLYGENENGLIIDALKRLKTWPEFERIYTQRSDLQILALVHLMDKMKKIIDAWLCYPNFNSCDDCDFTSTCNRIDLS